MFTVQVLQVSVPIDNVQPSINGEVPTTGERSLPLISATESGSGNVSTQAISENVFRMFGGNKNMSKHCYQSNVLRFILPSYLNLQSYDTIFVTIN